jgi:hypothetical protein
MLYMALQYQRINIIDDDYKNTYNKDKGNSS